MEHEYSVQIICSFLTPYELLKMRHLSSFHNKCTQNFITQTYRVKDITKFVCPVCSYWIESIYDLPMDNYTGFRDLYYHVDREERIRYRYIKSFLNSRPYQRVKLLCSDCENEEMEIRFIGSNQFVDVDTSPTFKKYFRYKGDREYKVVIKNEQVNSWGFLYLVDDTEYKYSWNEFSVIVPLWSDSYSSFESRLLFLV